MQIVEPGHKYTEALGIWLSIWFHPVPILGYFKHGVVSSN